MADLAIPDPLWQLRELFETIVSWGDRTLAEDAEARQHLVRAGYGLGAQRAEALGREMRAIDVEYGLALLCKWPIKPDISPALQEQAELVRAAIVPQASEGQRVALDQSVFTSSLDDLYALIIETGGPPLAAA